MKVSFLIILFCVIFGNYWIWKILNNNIFFGITAIIITFILGYSFKNKYLDIKLATVCLLLVTFLSFSLFNSQFDKKIISNTPEDILLLNYRHNYLADELGWLFQNKLTLIFFKNVSRQLHQFQRNLFDNLDQNLYFFANHPRERAGVGEFEKYPFILMPFFILGLLFIIKNRNTLLSIYILIIVILSALIKPSYQLGPVLFFPLITLLIALGINVCLRRIRN